MTKTKDPNWHKIIGDVNHSIQHIVEPPKRCDECRWRKRPDRTQEILDKLDEIIKLLKEKKEDNNE